MANLGPATVSTANPQPVSVVYDASGSYVGYWADGTFSTNPIAPVTAGQAKSLQSIVNSPSVAPRTLNGHDLMLAGPMLQLSLPSPYASTFTGLTNNEHAYGTPIYFPMGWRGYKWWMVGAPYPTQVQGTVTISNSSPAIISYTGHPFQPGMAVQFTTTGSLPTGLTTGGIYYVLGDANFSANQFAVSSTLNGAAINTSSAGSGTQKCQIFAAKYENPCIYVSNDGENYVRAPGANAPLFDPFSFTGTDANSYYADPYIAYDPTLDKLYVLFCWFNRAGTVKSSLVLTESSDGINWTTPVEILQSTTTGFTPNTPSLLRTSAGWKIVAIDTRDGTGTFSYIVTATTSSTPYTGWTAPGSVFNGAWTQATATHPLSRQWWHQFSVLTADGDIVSLAGDSGSGGGAAYSLYSSDGGITYSVQPFSAWDTGSAQGTWYRPGICVCNDSANPSYRLFASRINGATDLTSSSGFYMKTAPLALGYSADTVQRMSLRDMVDRKIAAPSNLRATGLVFWDSFNGRTPAAVLGTSDCGVAWVQPDANNMVISASGNGASPASTSNCRAYVDPGLQNYDLEVQVQTVGTSWNVLFGYIDTNNYWRFGNSVSPSGIQRVASGAISTTSPSGWTAKVTISNGDIIRISKRGQRYTIYQNDRPIDSFVDLWYATSTKVGLQASGAVATVFDNFIVRAG